MKCFHFTSDEESSPSKPSLSTKPSWTRSFSVASSTATLENNRRSDFDSFDPIDSLLVTHQRNDLASFSFSLLKTATRGFSRGLMIGEGGFGCVYKGFVTVDQMEIQVAVKQLNRNGFQATHWKTLFVPISTEFDSLDHDLAPFSFSVLKTATRGFSKGLMISEGGFGCVYKGFITVDGMEIEVAVKRLNRSGFQGHKEWINEVNFLGVVKHPNLVKLVGYCAEDDERGIQRLLVYELMGNKSLEDHLLGRITCPLPWMTRLKIAQDAARGLAYLHEEMDFQLIFRDFKTSNILLDENFNAKLSDFGLARLGPPAGLSHVSTAVVGTVGYAAPEYIHTGKLTVKSDVWSFGVVLYELITGRRSVERNLPRSEQKLLDWVRPYVSDSKKFHLIVDPRLEGSYCIKSVQKLASLANKCLMKQPKSRPKMSEVVEILENIISQLSLQEDVVASPDREAGIVEEEMKEEAKLFKKGKTYKGFDFKDIVSLRTKSITKLDWRIGLLGW